MADGVTFRDYHRRVWAIVERRPRRAAGLAMRLYEQAPPGPNPERAWAAFTCGLAHLACEHFPHARRSLDEALALFEQLGVRDGELRCRHVLLTIDHLSGAGLGLQECWRALAADYAAAGDQLGAARVGLDRAAHLNVLARPDEALQILAEVAPQIEASAPPADRARLLRLSAIAHTTRGEFSLAADLIERATLAYRTLGLAIDVAKCLHERGWLHVRQDQLSEARGLLERALARFQASDLPLNAALCEKNLGLIASRLGDYERATALTVRARARFLALGRLDFVAHCELHLGIIAYYNGLYAIALDCYRWAEAHYVEHGTPRTRLVKRNRALALRAQGDLAGALALLVEVGQSAGDTGDTAEQMEALFEQAKVHRDLGDPATALALLTHAEAQFAAIGNVAASAECQLERGWIHLLDRAYQQAEGLFLAARPALGSRPWHHWRIDYGLGRCAEAQGATFVALGSFRQASATVAGLRRHLLSEHASSAIFVQAHQLFRDALRLAARMDDPLAVVELTEQQRAAALQRQIVGGVGLHDQGGRQREEVLRARLQPYLGMETLSSDAEELLLTYLTHLLQARYALVGDDPPPLEALDLPALRGRLDSAFPAGWTLLIYALSDDQLVIVSLDEQGARLDQAPLAGPLQQAIERATRPAWRRMIYLDAMRLSQPERSPWADLEMLSRSLLPQRLRGALHPARRLLLLPAGPLHNLPWAALRLEDAWLCERCVPQIVPSLALWPLLANRRPASDALLFVGCSAFGGRAADLPALPDEYALVAARWPGPHDHLLEADASTRRLHKLAEAGALRQYGVVHIASHARLVGGHGLLAHLKLWDADLLLDEVSRLKLEGATVVLATCDGAVGEALAGEELLSLGRAFLVAGAREVVASLWPTYDAPIQALLDGFYTGLAQGHDAAVALVLAQRSLAQRYRLGMPAADPTSPLVWGGFTFLGAGSQAPGDGGGYHVPPPRTVPD